MEAARADLDAKGFSAIKNKGRSRVEKTASEVDDMLQQALEKK